MHTQCLALPTRLLLLMLCACLQWGCVSGGEDDAATPTDTGAGAPAITAPPPVTGVVSPPADPAGTPSDESGALPGELVVKRHPGHYIALNDWDGDVQLLQAVRPGVTGIHKRYPWADLEPEPGVYDFSRVEADLVLAADHGMRFVIMIEDKSFSMDVRRTPAYLHENYTLPYIDGGWVTKRWDPWVQERLSLLTRALGERFDAHPWFEGVAFQESAMGFTPQIQTEHGYTPEKYRDAIMQMLISTRAHFPRSQVFWYMNFLEGKQAYLGDIAEVAAEHGIAMGGPDILPDSWPLNFHTYPLYERFAGRMTMFNSVQYDSYKHVHLDADAETKYWTPEELFVFARDRLHVDYLFWTRKPQRDPTDSYHWIDALPVIAANPVIRNMP